MKATKTIDASVTLPIELYQALIQQYSRYRAIRLKIEASVPLKLSLMQAETYRIW